MEQRLDATYLRSGPFERATAIGIVAVAIGTGILLAAWGISLLWRYTPPELAVRIANPEVRVTQDKPFILAQPEPFKVERPSPPFITGDSGVAKTAAGDVITREVTVFSNVNHGPGTVVTGWNYKDGSGGIPVRQYCYYAAPNVDRSSIRVNIAFDSAPAPHVSALLVPDLEKALAKCQWWQG